VLFRSEDDVKFSRESLAPFVNSFLAGELVGKEVSVMPW
jgi:hypothetical protein